MVLSGGSLGLYDRSITNDFVALMNFKVPIIGFCMCHEVIATAFGGSFKKLNKEYGYVIVLVTDKYLKRLV